MTAAHHEQDQATERRYDEYYERYGKPLEQDHRGKYLAVSSKGDTLLGDSLLDVAQKAQETFGADNFLYKVGEKAVGHWR